MADRVLRLSDGRIVEIVATSNASRRNCLVTSAGHSSQVVARALATALAEPGDRAGHGGGVATVVMSISTLLSLIRTRADYYRSQTLDRPSFASSVHLLPCCRGFERSRESRGRGPSRHDGYARRARFAGAWDRTVLSSRLGIDRESIDCICARARLGTRRSGEVLVSEAFAAAHGLHPGSPLTAVINGKQQRLRSSGSCFRQNTSIR